MDGRQSSSSPPPPRVPGGRPDLPGSSGSPFSGSRSILLWVLLALAAFWAWQAMNVAEQGDQLSYSRFHQELATGNVAQVTVKGQRISGKLTKAVSIQGEGGAKHEVQKFYTFLPSFGDEQLLADLEKQGVEIRTEPQSGFSWVAVLLSVGPFVLLFWLGYLFLRRAQSQGGSLFGLGKSPATPYDRRRVRTTFEDVAGAVNTKRELTEIIEFLKDPTRFRRLGGEVPHGVLLQGPPGTGKTLMARAVAGEADVPFFSITGSDFMEMLVGVGASRVRDLFREAKKAAPSIIFIDELDSIGRRRGTGLGGGHDEREQTLNQLLSAMDGFEPHQSVVVMAATNRPDILDPALLRPGRFDRTVTVDLPMKDARLQILRIHSRNKPLADDVDLDEVARSTPGFSGADLENLLNEAALLAARRDADSIAAADIEEARDKVIMGLEREGLDLGSEDLRTLAYHEAGHAVLAAVLPNSDSLHKVTIVPRGRAMGVTQVVPERERYIFRREVLMDRLAVLLGGRAAEEGALGTATSGAESDLKQVTRLARKMVLDWGMSERLPHLAPGSGREQVFLGEQIGHPREYSEATAHEVDKAVEDLIGEAWHRATTTLEKHRRALDRLAEALVEHEELPRARVLEIVGVQKTAEEAPKEEDPVPVGS